ncbi:hypothetical protein JCM24511_01098 [Saitozyma sp. JCM 24511]|nr:hypothetical protein JCM24511_01098 [Saitozyma sp. JCM 24511]
MPIDFHVRLPEALTRNLNFFRIHLTVFTLTPLIFACIFYGANGSATGNANSTNVGVQRVEFVDSLFLCFSAMTVTGLVTVNVSATHPFQQALLFILFILGDYSVVSLVMVLVRKRFFRQHCAELLRSDRLRRTNSVAPEGLGLGRMFTKSFTFHPTGTKAQTGTKTKTKREGGKPAGSGTVLISGPTNVRPVDNYVEEGHGGERPFSDSPTTYGFSEEVGPTEQGSSHEGTTEAVRDQHEEPGREEENGDGKPQANPQASPLVSDGGILLHDHDDRPSFSHGIHIATPSDHMFTARQRLRAASRAMSVPHALTHEPLPLTRTMPAIGAAVHDHHPSLHITDHLPHPHHHPQYSGFGGFPGPIELVQRLLPDRTRQNISRRLSQPQRRMTLLTPSLPALPSLHPEPDPEESWTDSIRSQVSRWMPASLNGLVIGRNSRFYTEELSDEDLEQLGGVEYRALQVLSRLVAGYIIFFQLVPFMIVAIYFAKVTFWDSVFLASPGTQAGNVNKAWFSVFQVVAAYTGSGLSLIDQSMVPFASCYLLIYALDIAMVAGNHALPMTLRLVIWLGTKMCRKGSDRYESLHFLLDHPRRCFLYLFPSHQTWYLVLIFFAFSAIEMFSFLVLDIGLPVLYDYTNGWELFSDALLQSLSVRASGFGIVSISSLAPSVLFIYVILMYVAIYPIAMSVRSTNVYEERALGVYHHPDQDWETETPEPEIKDFHKGHRREVFSKYLAWHMRRQLAFDIWPLALAIWAICCFERGKILNPETSGWFTVFRIIFECTSAYSTIGLSMGTPNNNYSFSGEFGTASKIVVSASRRGRWAESPR